RSVRTHLVKGDANRERAERQRDEEPKRRGHARPPEEIRDLDADADRCERAREREQCGDERATARPLPSEAPAHRPERDAVRYGKGEELKDPRRVAGVPRRRDQKELVAIEM